MSVSVPEPPAPPAAVCAVAVTGLLLPETLGCTGSSGNPLVLCGSLWSGSGTAPSWPGSTDRSSRRKTETDEHWVVTDHLINNTLLISL